MPLAALLHRGSHQKDYDYRVEGLGFRVYAFRETLKTHNTALSRRGNLATVKRAIHKDFRQGLTWDATACSRDS